MEIINIFGKKCIRHGQSILVSDTEENVINFYKHNLEMDKKYLHTFNFVYENGMAYHRRLS